MSAAPAFGDVPRSTRYRQRRRAIELDLPTPGFRLGGRNDEYSLLGRQCSLPSFPRLPTAMPAQGDLCTTVLPTQRDLCTTVIPAQAGIQGRGFPARNPSHLRHTVSRSGSYAKVSVRGKDGGGGRAPGSRLPRLAGDGGLWVRPSPSVVPVETGYPSPAPRRGFPPSRE